MRKKLIALFILFALCGSVYAQVPYVKKSFFKNFGGLNDQLSATEIEDNEASDIQNVVFDTGGVIKKRNGFLTIPTSPLVKVISGNVTAITGLKFYEQNDGSKHIVVVANVGGKPYVVKKTYVNDDIPQGLWEDIHNNSIAPQSGYTDNDLVSFAVAEDLVILALDNTTQTKPFKWSGTGGLANLTSDGDCPSSTIVLYHKNHLFLAGDDSNPSRVSFSALDDIATYVATDFFDVQTADGSKVRGLVSAFNSLYIFKDESIWRLSGFERDTFVLQKMVSGIGTSSHQSIAVIDDAIFFTTTQGDIAAYNGGYSVVFVSKKIRETVDGLNFSRANKSLGLAFSTYRYNDFDYYTSVSNGSSATHNRVLLFDLAFESWTKFVGMNINAWDVADDNDGKKAILFGDYAGYVHQYPSTKFYDGDVDESAIDAFYQTKWFRFDDLALGDKYLRIVKSQVLSETSLDTFLTLDVRSDFQVSGNSFSIPISSSGSLWGAFTWGEDSWAGQSLIVDRRETNKGTDMFQLHYSNNKISESFSLFGFQLYLEPTDRT